nr:MAG TPA: hypothetical protein [Caudoviricetes sp.]
MALKKIGTIGIINIKKILHKNTYICNIFCIFAVRIGRSSYLLTRVQSRPPSSSVFFRD